MNESQKKIRIIFFILLLITGLIIFQCFYSSKIQVSLLPSDKSPLMWRSVISSDSDYGGKSTYTLKQASEKIEYDFILGDKDKYPYVSFALRFDNFSKQHSPHLDLSMYDKAIFSAKCNFSNIMSFTLYTYMEGESIEGDLLTYRIPTVYFDCNSNSSEIVVHLDKMENPEWWRGQHANLASNNYSLTNVASITFGNTAESPKEQLSRVSIDRLILERRNWALVIVGAIILIVMWTLFVLLAVKKNIRNTENLLVDNKNENPVPQRKLPEIVGEPLSIVSQKDKIREGLLKFIATEYSNPQLDIDIVIQRLGMNRSKINEVLKNEVGLTFNAYLNKIRLTEAARLLADSDSANVSEVAYRVGYNNIPYFNRLFKEEFNCTPKLYRSLNLEK
jgi:AraC-like DNA-binding protein